MCDTEPTFYEQKGGISIGRLRDLSTERLVWEKEIDGWIERAQERESKIKRYLTFII